MTMTGTITASVPFQAALLLEAVKYRWSLHARTAQHEPLGDWRYWLIQAGRGFGKTRTGAEMTRQWAKHYRFVNLIGATADDARDIMIEGESGILAICPRQERPTYVKNAARLDWPSGCRSLIFTADRPDRLRGKQHEKLWCLVGDTRVLMADGSEKPIRDMRAGDWVQTRRGARRVIGHALTKRNASIMRLGTVGRRSIMGTADHPVWVEGQGFIPLASVQEGMSVCVTNASNGAGRPGIATTMGTTSRWFACIARCGKRLMGRFRQAITFTTSTATRVITGWGIWSLCPTESTAQSTLKRTLALIVARRYETPSPYGSAIMTSAYRAYLSASCAVASIAAEQSIRLGTVPGSVLKSRDLGLFRGRSGSASTVGSPTMPSSVCNATAPGDAVAMRASSGERKARPVMWSVRSVARSFRARAPMPDSVAGAAPCVSTQRIATVSVLASRADVYDIAVDGEREFFANGVLVHNCDELAAWRYDEAWDQALLGLRLGDNPQVIVTTTPRPTKIIRDLRSDPHTIVTGGSTYENRANLAPAFLDKIIRQYEGTRLGRQEILAELLEDVPGALWNLTMLDALRVAQASSLVRVVVGVDPSVTSTGDEAGIVVAGLGTNGHGYVLADDSLQGSPNTWGSAAVKAYHTHQADRVVAEVNNGGEMVGLTIATVDPRVSYKAVHASRGKRTRAEPVAALYEQGRVHHVGAFSKLEDEMCHWTPEDSVSPNRMDALVWVLTELMLGEVESEQDVMNLADRVEISPY